MGAAVNKFGGAAWLQAQGRGWDPDVLLLRGAAACLEEIVTLGVTWKFSVERLQPCGPWPRRTPGESGS